MQIKIAPSILAADFANLQAEALAMQNAGADWLHVDVMDGHFVPNLSLGVPVVASLRKKTSLGLDVHLMITDPLAYAPRFIESGADWIVFHLESSCNPNEVIELVHKLGRRCGISIKPGTPAETLYPYLPMLDLILVMTVEPGFGGQKFMEGMLPKISALRRECDNLGLNTDIEVDGGIDEKTIGRAAAAGANIFVAGSALFSSADYGKAVAQLRAAALRG